MKKYLLSPLLLINLIAFGQCGVKSYNSESGHLMVQANMEEIYRNVGDNNNGDFTVGAFLFYGQLFTKGEQKNQWGFTAVTYSVGRFEKIIPREMKISFDNGTSVSLKAYAFEPATKENPSDVCGFYMSTLEAQYFNYGISTIQISDNRTGQTIKFSPSYKYIFKEQYDCINKY